MPALPVADVAAALRRRFESLPKLPFLIAGFVLFLLGLWTRSMGGFTGLKRFCDGVVTDLGLIQPFTLFRVYFSTLATCDHYDTHINCSPWRYLNPVRLAEAVVQTGYFLWQRSVGPGRFLLPLLLIASFALAVQLIKLVQNRVSTGPTEFNLLHTCLAAAMAPVVGSVLALVFQVAGIVIFFVFGWVIGLVLWLVGTFGGLWAVWRQIREVVDKGKKVEEAVNTISTYLGDDSKGDRAMG
jgi:hypothetical protein